MTFTCILYLHISVLYLYYTYTYTYLSYNTCTLYLNRSLLLEKKCLEDEDIRVTCTLTCLQFMSVLEE